METKLELPDIYIQMIISLLILAAIAAFQVSAAQVVVQLLLAVVPAALLDLAVKGYRLKKLQFPKSAVITGMLVAMVMNFGAPWYALVSASLIAIASKHMIRVGARNIFNPAMFGLLSVFMIFGVGTAWWGGSSLIAVLVLGLLVAYRIKKLAMSIAFIAVFEALFALLNPHLVSTMPLAVLNPLTLFFAFLMLIEHKTSPLTLRSGMAYSVIVGVIAALLFAVHSRVDFLLLALAIGNLFVAFNNRLGWLR